MHMTQPTSPQAEGSKKGLELDQTVVDRVVEMAWEDRTPFDAITLQFGLTEAEVIKLMRREMKLSSFRMWRARVQGRITKHQALRNFKVGRNRSDQQRNITLNKISKRRLSWRNIQ